MVQFERYITCIDAHTGGEPLRIITSGFPPIPGKTILEKRDYVNAHWDGLRRMLMLEPRGHAGMYGCILTPPVTPDGDFGVLFTHNEGLSSMCGHGIIGVTKVVLETGMMPMEEGENIVRIDAPAGRITAWADVEGGKVKQVRFQNVPCFVYRRDISVEVDGVGPVRCDIVYCGAFYVYVDAGALGLAVTPEQAARLVEAGMEIKRKVMAEHEIVHPVEKGINWLYGTILTDPLTREGNRLLGKNICIFAEGQIDRSPTGTGTGGRVALHYARGEMGREDLLINRSVIDTVMEGRIVEETMVDTYPAVVTEVGGTAHIMGFNNLVLDPEDPLPEGFYLLGN